MKYLEKETLEMIFLGRVQHRIMIQVKALVVFLTIYISTRCLKMVSLIHYILPILMNILPMSG